MQKHSESPSKLETGQNVNDVNELTDEENRNFSEVGLQRRKHKSTSKDVTSRNHSNSKLAKKSVLSSNQSRPFKLGDERQLSSLSRDDKSIST